MCDVAILHFANSLREKDDLEETGRTLFDKFSISLTNLQCLVKFLTDSKSEKAEVKLHVLSSQLFGRLIGMRLKRTSARANLVLGFCLPVLVMQ